MELTFFLINFKTDFFDTSLSNAIKHSCVALLYFLMLCAPVSFQLKDLMQYKSATQQQHIQGT
jgi:hypothetical protein